MNLIVTPALTSDNPISALKKDFLKGYKLTQDGKFEKAASQFQKIRGLDVALRDYILYYLGKSLHAQKRCDESRSVFQELLENYPESRWAGPARLQIESGESCPPLETPSYEPPKLDCEEAPAEQLRRESGLAGSRSGGSGGAGGPPDEKDRADCYFSARSYLKAKEIYRRLAEHPGAEVSGILILTRLSQSAARSQDFKTAIEANREIRSRYPRSRAAEEAQRKIAFLHQDSQQYKAAIFLLKELLIQSRAAQERRVYWERIGWCQFRLEKYQDAVAGFESATAISETPYSLYWKGRSLERLGKKDEAAEIFRSLSGIYPGTYYGIRALERLANPLHGEARAREDMRGWWTAVGGRLGWVETTESADGSGDLERIYELTALGLIDDAQVETRRARLKNGWLLPSDPKRIARVASGGGFTFEVRSPREENPDYPLPYGQFLFAGADGWKETRLDPYLLYAMMRQESRFRPSVVSPAGAIGLLQIMPYTGRKLAKEAGWEDYQPQWLYDPVTNIELSIRYVRKLWNLLDGKWYAVAASYNAGEHVVAEWLKQRRGLLEEEWIEEIPYAETRDYVKKIYTNWKAYRVIYGAD